ncbi:unnamed protein product [Prunus armeniaca]|nr:unnamed protein product [Prunus armeniaca]
MEEEQHKQCHSLFEHEHDPLLLTDVPSQQNSSFSTANSHSDYTSLCSQLQRLTMVDPDSSS